MYKLQTFELLLTLLQALAAMGRPKCAKGCTSFGGDSTTVPAAVAGASFALPLPLAAAAVTVPLQPIAPAGFILRMESTGHVHKYP